MSLKVNKAITETVVDSVIDTQRRDFFKLSASTLGASVLSASALMGLVPGGIRSQAWAAGSDAPEITEVKIGFIPLTDCAPIVVAAEIDRKSVV